MQAGSYCGKIVCAVNTSSRKGTPGIIVTVNVDFQYVDGEPKDIEPFEQQIRLYFAPGENERISCEQLQRVGWNGSLRTPDFKDESKTAGVPLKMKIKSYEGKSQEEWSFGDVEAPPATDAECSRIEAYYRAKFGKTSKPAGKPTPPTTAPVTPVADAEYRKLGYVDADAPEPAPPAVAPTPATKAEMDKAGLPF